MKILWMSWKDLDHPSAGGAEVVKEELAKRLVAGGHEVTLLVGGFTRGASLLRRNGFEIIRVGSRFSVYWHAFRYYKKHCVGNYNIVIDEMNTVPFFASLYVKEPVVLFVHQLCREIWFYQMSFPFSWIGYVLEPIYLRLLAHSKVVTVSQSTKHDLMRYGFSPEKIHIISEGISLTPIQSLDSIQKYPDPTILSLGEVRPMKRTLDIVKAFNLVASGLENAWLIIAGEMSGPYGVQVREAVSNSPFQNRISYVGRVSEEKKIELLQKSHILAVTSVKEGWGLVVTEANSQGTPAVVYNVDGLRDSVRDDETGLICAKNTQVELARSLSSLLRDKELYTRLRQNGWQWSKEITFDRAYKDFAAVLSRGE